MFGFQIYQELYLILQNSRRRKLNTIKYQAPSLIRVALIASKFKRRGHEICKLFSKSLIFAFILKRKPRP